MELAAIISALGAAVAAVLNSVYQARRLNEKIVELKERVNACESKHGECQRDLAAAHQRCHNLELRLAKLEE